MRILGIDPGLSGTGWAVLNDNNELVSHGVLNFRSDKLSFQKRAMQYGRAIRDIQNSNGIQMAGIEYPAFFDSAGGTMVAKKGDLLKLTFLVGIIYSYLRRNPQTKVLLVPVHEWKGQLPKLVVIQRIKMHYGSRITRNLKSHDWDATGIAMHLGGIRI